MTFARTEYYEIAAVIAYGSLFALWERLRPAHDRRAGDWRRNAIAIGVLVVGLALARTGVKAAVESSGLATWLVAQPWRRWPKLAQIVTAGVLLDFSLYWLHRLMHTRAFWNAHKWHHSSEQLTWVSGLRTSAVHVALFAVPQILIAFYVFPFSIADIGMASAGGVFNQFFIHANVRLPLGPLEYVLVTPQNHRRHHALVEGVAHGNYATVYAFWDRLFGTYVDYRELPKNYPLGIGEPAEPTPRMLIGI
jgi:sterol desaturase/sphingolipid hydroxylase (fatty acid hydroxylase superfamily)